MHGGRGAHTDYINFVQDRERVTVEVAGVDLGIANLFSLHSTTGRRARMSQGEYRALAKLDSHEEQAATWARRANLPALPDLNRPGSASLFEYVAVLYKSKQLFDGEYRSLPRLHARLTVRRRGVACMPRARRPPPSRSNRHRSALLGPGPVAVPGSAAHSRPLAPLRRRCTLPHAHPHWHDST